MDGMKDWKVCNSIKFNNTIINSTTHILSFFVYCTYFSLKVGFGSYLIALLLIAFGYLALSLCLAELASCVSFGGT